MKNLLYTADGESGLSRVSGKKYRGRLQDDQWGSRLRDTRDLSTRPVTSHLKKRFWQLMKSFKLLCAPKHSSSWHPNCQCCLDVQRESPTHHATDATWSELC